MTKQKILSGWAFPLYEVFPEAELFRRLKPGLDIRQASQNVIRIFRFLYFFNLQGRRWLPHRSNTPQLRPTQDKTPWPDPTARKSKQSKAYFSRGATLSHEHAPLPTPNLLAARAQGISVKNTRRLDNPRPNNHDHLIGRQAWQSWVNLNIF